MLPDFPNTKANLHRRLMQRFEQKRNAELGIFGRMKAIVLPEGNRLIFQREDGTEQEMDFKAVEVAVNISLDEIKTLDATQMIAKFDQAALEMAQKQHIQALDEVSRAATAVGNAVDAQGEPMGPPQILRGLEEISINFNEKGEPDLPTMLIHPDMASPVREAFARIDEDPVLRRRFLEIMTKQREDWRARESRRKLVG